MKKTFMSGSKISTKLLISFGVVLMLALVLSYSLLRAVAKLGSSLDTAVNANAKKLQLAGEIRMGFEEMRAEGTKIEISQINMAIGRLDLRGGELAGCSACHTS